MAYRQLVDELCDVPRRRHRRRSSSASSAEMQAAASELEFERAARLRDRLTAVRKAIEKQQMVGRPQRGHRRDRHRRGRARSGGAGVLRPQGSGRRPQGVRRSTRSRTCTPGGLIDRILEAMYGDEPVGDRFGETLRDQAVRGERVETRPRHRSDLTRRESWSWATRNGSASVCRLDAQTMQSLVETATRIGLGDFEGVRCFAAKVS